MNVPTTLPTTGLHATIRSGQETGKRQRVTFGAGLQVSRTTKGTIVTATPAAGRGGVGEVVSRAVVVYL